MKTFIKYFLVAALAAAIGSVTTMLVTKDNNQMSLEEEELMITLLFEHEEFNNIASSPEAADCGFDDFFENDFAEMFLEYHNRVDTLLSY